MDPSSCLMPMLNPPCRIHANTKSVHIHAILPLPIITRSIPPSKSPHKQPLPKFPMPLKQTSCPHQFHAAIAHHSPSHDPCRRYLVNWWRRIIFVLGINSMHGRSDAILYVGRYTSHFFVKRAWAHCPNWSPSGCHVVVVWLPCGCYLVAMWLPCGCQKVVAKWLPGASSFYAKY